MALFDTYRDAAEKYQRQQNVYNQEYQDYANAYNAYMDPINRYNAAIDTYNTGLQGWKDKNLTEYDRINALRNEEITHAQTPGIHNQENIDYHAANIQRYLDQLNAMTASLPTAPDIKQYQHQVPGEMTTDEYGNTVQGEPTYTWGEFNEAPPVAPEPSPEYIQGLNQPQVTPQQQNTLYQQLYSRPTTDVLSNEAWSLANLSSPFMSSETGTAYDLGNVSRMNNPLYQAGANELTEGSTTNPESQISNMQQGNLYY